MTIWEIIIIAAGLSLDVYAYCLYKGAMLSELNKIEIAKLCVLFTVFQTAALVLGYCVRFLPGIAEHTEAANHHWMVTSAILFFVVGAAMMGRAFRNRKETILERLENRYNYRLILLWCAITSIDALLTGVGFTFLSIDLVIMLAVVGAATVIAVLCGIFLGYRLGCAAKNRFVTIGGCILLAGGVDVLLRYFV